MAWVEQDASGGYHLRFRFQGRKYKRTLETRDEEQANDLAGQARQMLRNIKLGLIAVPPDADLQTFVLSAGKTEKVVVPDASPTLSDLLNLYFTSMPEGSLESSTIEGMKIHQKQLERLIGGRTRLCEITQATLQEYINKRAKEQAKKNDQRKVAPATVKKALVSLRTAWNWGISQGLTKQPFPGRGLRYPKGSQKPPFQTRDEIERKLHKLNASERKAVEAELWDALYLTSEEVKQLLVHVKQHSKHPFIYPLVATAAYTGARRAELMRISTSDVDLSAGVITIHERKKSHDARTQRRIPISALLKKVLKDWIKSHPGGRALFCHDVRVHRSKTKRSEPTPLTRNEVHTHFKAVLKGSKWAVVKGLHCLRHSFISALASNGIDQRIIDDFVGHSTEEQRKRYRHLYPNVARQAILNVFG